MTPLLVFGATGFIGRQVCLGAEAAGRPVVAVGRTARTARTVQAADRRLDLATAPPGRIAELIEEVRPAAVINCAGATHGEPAELVAANVVAVANLLRALSLTPELRLVHLGSAAEYGAVPPGEPVSEATPPAPVGAYGITKLAGTELVRAAGLDAVVLRVFNPIGPGQPAGTLAGRLAAELRAGGDVRLGPLSAHRDFVDVRDVAAAVLVAAAAPGPLPGVLNVGSGRATPLRQLVDHLVALAGPGRQVSEEADASARSAGVRWQQADVGAIGRVLGWSAGLDLATSLRDLWEETACPANVGG